MLTPQTSRNGKACNEILKSSDGSAEFDFLVECCAAAISGEFEVSTSLVYADGDRLSRLAEYHRVLPQLQACLRVSTQGDASELSSKVGTEFAAIVQQNLLLTGELIHILQGFRQAGVQVLAYKGPALAQFLYGDFAGRQFGDLDLLVRPADLDAARLILERLGYAANLRLSASQQALYLASGYELGFSKAAGARLVELKWRIVPHFYAVDFSLDDLFLRSQLVEIGGSALRTLGAEDLFLVLCVHAAKHCWAQLSYLTDIGKLVATSSLDWTFVFDEARRLGLVYIVGVALQMTRELFSNSAPDLSPRDSAEGRRIQNLANLSLQILRSSCEPDTAKLQYFHFMMQLRERNTDRARFLWRLATTPGVDQAHPDRPSSKLTALERGIRLLQVATKVLSRVNA